MKRILRPPLAVLMRAALRLSSRRVGLVLLYHRVEASSGDPRRELVPAIARDLLAAHLRHLGRHYEVVPAAELCAVAAGRRRGQRLPIAITFDDDLPTHLEAAVPVLSDAGVTATFFLSGASLERPHSFWWERLQRAVDAGGTKSLRSQPALARAVPADDADIHAVGAAVQRLDEESARGFADALLPLAGPDPPDAGIRAAAVRALSDLGHEIGFHTRRHPRLTKLPPVAVEQAMREGLDELEAAAGTPITAIAYPHGAVDESVAAAARDAGYTRGYTTRPEPTGPGTDPLLIGRLDTFVLPVHRLSFTVPRAMLGRAVSAPPAETE